MQYETAGLDVADVAPDPIAQWRRWYEEATEARLVEPNAMVLATTGEDGRPDARYVLVREVSTSSGFVFHTNYDSPKSRQLAAHPYAAGVFTWLGLHRQVRIRGPIARVEPRGQRRLLRVATTRQPDRCVGLTAERGARRSRRSRSQGRR